MRQGYPTTLGKAVTFLCLFSLVTAPVARAATTYTFEDDTIGQTPANISVGAGTFDVQTDDLLGKSMRAVTQQGVIAAANFTSFASSSDQSVVWKQAYSNTLSRAGFTLRAQSADTGVANSVGAKQGYLFHVYDGNSVYIWRVGPSSYTSLYSGSLAKAEPRWFKATAIGTQLTFSYSNDGSVYTGLATVTDATYTGGTVQYTAGYGGSVGIDYVDDIVITNLDTDLTAPAVQTLSPADNATGVSPSANLVITFTESVDVESGVISLYKASDDSLVEDIAVTGGQITGTGTNTITINPTTVLDSSTSYYVTVAATAFDDVAGNSFAGITASTTWNFTTADVGTPALLSVSPQDGAADVATSTSLTLTFDEAVDAESGNITIKNAADDTTVAAIDVTSGLVTGSGTTAITVTPNTDLAPGTSYYIQIDATAFDDASGNSYAGIQDTTTWNFSTQAEESEEVEEETSHRRSTSMASRIRNLLRIGNTERAYELMRQQETSGVTPPEAIPVPTAVRDLEVGATGDDVRALQTLLIARGHAIPAGPTGYFGAQTQSALAAYQAATNITPAAGYFGVITRAQMTAAGIEGIWW